MLTHMVTSLIAKIIKLALNCRNCFEIINFAVSILYNAHPRGMAPLRPGLCPLLTEEVVEKLKSVGIKSGKRLSDNK